MRRVMCGVMILLVTVSMALAAESPEEPKADKAEPEAEGNAAKETRAPGKLYVPPARGKPRQRVGGAVRGIGDPTPEIYALVPAHTGQTVSGQPSLFWYLGGRPPTGSFLVFTLHDDDVIDPLVEKELPAPAAPGLQRIDLSDYGVSLELGTEYEWSVALVRDAARRSDDVVATGWIDRVPPPTALGNRPDARRYAAQGLWYDALAAADNDASLRDALLREVGFADLGPARDRH